MLLVASQLGAKVRHKTLGRWGVNSVVKGLDNLPDLNSTGLFKY
jgi:hypothetical protein